MVAAGRVHDYPRLKRRGLHLTFETIRQLTAEQATEIMEAAARLKLNTILLEFGERFPFERHKVVSAPSALTGAEVKAMVARAGELGMEAIPLLQSLGHLDYVLKHEEYAELREEEEVRHQMCPNKAGSFRLFTELAEEVLSYFRETEFLHIGADETRQLGVCPQCRAEAEATSKGHVYVKHTNKVCEWLAGRGVTPILWDDILCAHPHVMEMLHESAWVMYWDYWTTASPSPLVVARYRPEGKRGAVVYDRRWEEEWKPELADITRKAMSEFAEPIAMETELGGKFLEVFGDCLGDEFPKYVRAFPYLEYYQGKGRRVLGAPTCSGNTSEWLTLPDFARYGENIKTLADRCIEAKAEGLVTTAWYNFPAEILYFGVVATAQMTW
jgi:hypothetical protein